MKVCTRCHVAQPLENYRPRADKPGLRAECRACASQRETIRRYERKHGLERPKPVKQTCTPWQGAFDQDDNPLQDGQLFMPGPRSCGKRDCVNPAHVLVVANG